jgi:hypothetical protein
MRSEIGINYANPKKCVPKMAPNFEVRILVQSVLFNIQSLEFGNNETFDQIILHCLGVETQHSSHYTALADLLRNPRVTMQTLSIEQFRDEESD